MASVFRSLRAAGVWQVPQTALRYGQHRSIWNSLKSVDRDFLAFIQQKIDTSPRSVINWINKKRWQKLKEFQMYSRERHEALGSELSTAYVVVANGGMVKPVGSDTWIKREKGQRHIDLPDTFDPAWKLEAVERADMIFIYDTFCNFVNLEHLKYLGLAGGQFIDDWCLDRLVDFRDTLVCLDISNCPRVTENGLAALHKLRALKRLRMYNMEGVKNAEMVLLMLEDMLPGVVIETDKDYTNSNGDFISLPTLQHISEQDLNSLPGTIIDLPHNSTQSKSQNI